ncbi:hypothetical protein CC79DRAFT_839763 [Sarocladium strictum]
MPDIDPAALSRPANFSTPTLSSKTLSITAPGAVKISKSQAIPQRIDLEPLYTALKAAIAPEQWLPYKEATTEFLIGRLNQTEFAERVDPILEGPTPEKQHLHNKLISAIYANVTREMPDQGPAPWVSAHNKPITSATAKPVTGDAAERRLKGDVMQLPARDRRRIKDLVQNEFDATESLSNMFSDTYRRPSAVSEVPASAAAGGINKMNFDLEIRKRFAQPLAIESGEFPDVGMITGRMLPMCYEAGLSNGHISDAPQLMSIATEIFIKEALSQVFSRTRSNAPGDSGNAGFGPNIPTWIQTRKYKKQLRQEEAAAQRGELLRDKSGLLPVEYKAASERAPLGMADLRLALDMADVGLAQFPIITSQVLYGYREGELESWDDYTWYNDMKPAHVPLELAPVEINGDRVHELPNGHPDAMDIDNDTWWEGTENDDMDMLDGVLDSCLAVSS